MDDAAQTRIRHLLAMPNGIVLLTGPTGCGKSTTLYTFLSSLNTKERRIVTVKTRSSISCRESFRSRSNRKLTLLSPTASEVFCEVIQM